MGINDVGLRRRGKNVALRRYDEEGSDSTRFRPFDAFISQSRNWTSNLFLYIHFPSFFFLLSLFLASLFPVPSFILECSFFLFCLAIDTSGTEEKENIPNLI